MKRIDGFTLVEIIITLVVISILAAVGIPGLGRLMANNQAIANTNNLVTALSFSRSESVKRGVQISLCAKSAAEPANTTCGVGVTDWSNGWFVFVDPVGSASTVERYAPPTADQLRSWPAPAGDFTTTGPTSVSFNSDGSIKDGPVELTISYSHCTGQQDHSITVETTGRASTSHNTCT